MNVQNFSYTAYSYDGEISKSGVVQAVSEKDALESLRDIMDGDTVETIVITVPGEEGEDK